MYAAAPQSRPGSAYMLDQQPRMSSYGSREYQPADYQPDFDLKPLRSLSARQLPPLPADSGNRFSTLEMEEQDPQDDDFFQSNDLNPDLNQPYNRSATSHSIRQPSPTPGPILDHS